MSKKKIELKFRLKMNFESKIKITKDVIKQFVENSIKGIKIKSLPLFQEEKDTVIVEVESNLQEILFLKPEVYDKAALLSKERQDTISDRLLISLRTLSQQLKAQNVNNPALLKQAGMLTLLAEVNHEFASNAESKLAKGQDNDKTTTVELQQIIQELDGELKKVNKEKAELINQRNEMASSMDVNLMEQIESLKKEVTELRQKESEKSYNQRELEAAYKSLALDLAGKDEEIRGLRRSLSASYSEIGKTSIDNKSTENEELKQIHEESLKPQKDIRYTEDKKRITIANIQEITGKIQERMFDVMNNLGTVAENYYTKSIAIDKKVSLIGKYLNGNMVKKHKEKDLLKDLLNKNTKKFITSLKNISEAILTTNNNLMKFIPNIQQTIIGLIKAKEEYKQKSKRLAKEMDDMLVKNDELKKRLDEYEIEKGKLEGIIEVQKTQIGRMTADVTILHEACNKTTISQAELTKEILELNNTKSELLERYNREKEEQSKRYYREKNDIKTYIQDFFSRITNSIEGMKSSVRKRFIEMMHKLSDEKWTKINQQNKLLKELMDFKLHSTTKSSENTLVQEKAQSKIKKLTEAKTKLQEQINQYEITLKERDANIELLNIKVIELNNLNTVHEEKYVIMKKYFDETKEQSNTIIKTLELQFKSDYKKLKSFIINKISSFLSTQYSSISIITKSKAFEMINQARNNYSEQVKRLRQKIISLEDLVADKDKNLALVNQEISEEKSKLIILGNEIRNMKENFTLDMNKRNALLKTQFKEMHKSIIITLQKIHSNILSAIIKSDKTNTITELTKKTIEKNIELNRNLKITKEDKEVILKKFNDGETLLINTKREIDSLETKRISHEKEFKLLTENLAAINEKLRITEEELKYTKEELVSYKAREPSLKDKIEQLNEEGTKLTESVTQIQKLNSELNEDKLKLEEAECKLKKITEGLIFTIRNVEDNKQEFDTISQEFIKNSHDINSVTTEGSFAITNARLMEENVKLDDQMKIDNKCSIQDCKNYKIVFQYKADIENLQKEIQTLVTSKDTIQKKLEQEVETSKKLENLEKVSSEEHKNSIQMLKDEIINIKKLLDNQSIPTEIKKSLLQNSSVKTLLLNTKQIFDNKFNTIPIILGNVTSTLNNIITRAKLLQQRFSLYKNQNVKLIEDKSKLETANIHLNKLIKERNAMIEELKSDYTSKEAELSTLQTKFKMLDDQKKKLEQIAETMSNSNAQLTKTVESHQKELTQVSKELICLEGSNQRLDQELQTKEKTIDRLIADKKRDIEALSKKLGDIIKDKEQKLLDLEKKYKEDMLKYSAVKSIQEQRGDNTGKVVIEYKNEIGKLVQKVNTQEKEIANLNKLVKGKGKPEIVSEENYKILLEKIKKKEQELEFMKEEQQVILADNRKQISLMIDQISTITKEYGDYKVESIARIKQLTEANGVLENKLKQELNQSVNKSLDVSKLKAIQAFLQIYRTEINNIKETMKSVDFSVFYKAILNKIESEYKAIKSNLKEYNKEITQLCNTFTIAEQKRQELYKNKITKLEALKQLLTKLVETKTIEEIMLSNIVMYFPYFKELDLKNNINLTTCIIKAIEHKNTKLQTYHNEYKDSLANLQLLNNSSQLHKTN